MKIAVQLNGKTVTHIIVRKGIGLEALRKLARGALVRKKKITSRQATWLVVVPHRLLNILTENPHPPPQVLSDHELGMLLNARERYCTWQAILKTCPGSARAIFKKLPLIYQGGILRSGAFRPSMIPAFAEVLVPIDPPASIDDSEAGG
jgi:hypothetical protein